MPGRLGALRRGTTEDTAVAPPFNVQRRRGRFPPFPLVTVRHEPAVDLGDHRDMAVPELAGDEFKGHPCPHHVDGPMVAGIVESVVGQVQHAQLLAVRIAGPPAVEPPEESLARQRPPPVSLDVRPRPVCHPGDPVPRPSFRAPRPYFLPRGVDPFRSARGSLRFRVPHRRPTRRWRPVAAVLLQPVAARPATQGIGTGVGWAAGPARRGAGSQRAPRPR